MHHFSTHINVLNKLLLIIIYAKQKKKVNKCVDGMIYIGIAPGPISDGLWCPPALTIGWILIVTEEGREEDGEDERGIERDEEEGRRTIESVTSAASDHDDDTATRTYER